MVHPAFRNRSPHPELVRLQLETDVARLPMAISCRSILSVPESLQARPRIWGAEPRAPAAGERSDRRTYPKTGCGRCPRCPCCRLRKRTDAGPGASSGTSTASTYSATLVLPYGVHLCISPSPMNGASVFCNSAATFSIWCMARRWFRPAIFITSSSE
jgi:hypothetical protein